MKRFAVVLLMALMAASIVFAGRVEAGAPIRIGALYPITGSLALPTKFERRGERLGHEVFDLEFRRR